ncbi:hypothetical protein scyTo_0020972, partial [Scyliorhinus torazame]|nr:hypothetical protein [Scyliorhinus torazame]
YAKIFHKLVRTMVPDCDVRFVLSEQGTGKGAAMVTAVAQRLVDQRKYINKILVPFNLNRDQLLDTMENMRIEMERGLKRETHSAATVKMLPTYIHRFPDGTGMSDYRIVIRKSLFNMQVHLE